MSVITISLGKEELTMEEIRSRIDSNLSLLATVYKEYIETFKNQNEEFLALSDNHRRDATRENIIQLEAWLSDTRLSALYSQIESIKERLLKLTAAAEELERMIQKK